MNKLDVDILVHMLRTIDSKIHGDRQRQSAETPTPFQATAAKYWLRMGDVEEIRAKLNKAKLKEWKP
jgi:hypothetical protein